MKDKSSIVNSFVTRKRYTTASRVTVSLRIKYQTKNKVEEFGKVFGKRRQKVRKREVVGRTRKNILQRRNTKNIQKSSAKSSSRELIIDFRLKKLHFYRERLAAFQQNTYHDKETFAT